MTNSTVTQEVMIATKDDISRLESSVKELTVAVKEVILLGERQTVQGKRIGDLETEQGVLLAKIQATEASWRDKYNSLERKVDTWVSRGVGAWFAIVIIAGILNFLTRK